MTTAYPLHWPPGWPRTTARQSSRFNTSLTAALKNVEDSLRRFGADSGKPITGIVISSNYTLGSARPADPGIAVYFTWAGTSTCIAVDRYVKLEENLQAIHHCLEAERTKLRHGGINVVLAAFRGYAALPPPGTTAPWWEVLGLPQGAPKEMIKARYHSLAKQLHPDTGAGGDAAAMARVNAAYQEGMRA